MKDKFKSVLEGEPQSFKEKATMYISCCGCGLVHLIVPDIIRGRLYLRFYRDDWETNQEKAKTRRRKK